MIYSLSIITCGFLLSFIVTTWLIRWGIPKLEMTAQKTESLPESSPQKKIFDFRSTGFWIGFFETLLVFAFVYAEDYGALAIIIGAKEFVRKEKIQDNPSYYLLGTLINVSIGLVFALTAKTIVAAL